MNADYPVWRELWMQFATWFGVAPGTPRKFSLAQYMADKAPVWERIVAKHGLRKTQLHTLVLWPYGDYQLRPDWEIMSSMDAARGLGFDDSVDTSDMFARQFCNYRRENIIPAGASI